MPVFHWLAAAWLPDCCLAVPDNGAAVFPPSSKVFVGIQEQAFVPGPAVPTRSGDGAHISVCALTRRRSRTSNAGAVLAAAEGSGGVEFTQQGGEGILTWRESGSICPF